MVIYRAGPGVRSGSWIKRSFEDSDAVEYARIVKLDFIFAMLIDQCDGRRQWIRFPTIEWDLVTDPEEEAMLVLAWA
jgi:hypothetical protein